MFQDNGSMAGKLMVALPLIGAVAYAVWRLLEIVPTFGAGAVVGS